MLSSCATKHTPPIEPRTLCQTAAHTLPRQPRTLYQDNCWQESRTNCQDNCQQESRAHCGKGAVHTLLSTPYHECGPDEQVHGAACVRHGARGHRPIQHKHGAALQRPQHKYSNIQHKHPTEMASLRPCPLMYPNGCVHQGPQGAFVQKIKLPC